jgi:hypothetical protein
MSGLSAIWRSTAAEYRWKKEKRGEPRFTISAKADYFLAGSAGLAASAGLASSAFLAF